MNIQFTYACKREAKLEMQALTTPGATIHGRPVQALFRGQICIPSARMRSDLGELVQHVGSEYVHQELFLRFLCIPMQ